ncbi:conserved Plasmodium protein, unknown function [Plasmodium chabaudi chabaudi]|uniref:Dynein heavy chain C-terminal domain-containing protein n=1 Tax=Plasmodium chabaudi chabaudi TaxID=31271 RepID=A0A1C6X7H8_PLACU|nr:conserved Plasmodium protein, unknown function [Plasmodium chabaudi chabaudi]
MNYSLLKKKLIENFNDVNNKVFNYEVEKKKKKIDLSLSMERNLNKVSDWEKINKSNNEDMKKNNKKTELNVLNEIDDILSLNNSEKESTNVVTKSVKNCVDTNNLDKYEGSQKNKKLGTALSTTVSDNFINNNSNNKLVDEKKKKNKNNEEVIFKENLNIVESSFSAVNKWRNHIDLIEFVKNNLKNNEFIYVKSQDGQYEKVSCHRKKEVNVISISLNGVLINEKNETSFYELSEWKNYVTMLNNAMRLNFIKKFKLYKYYFLLKNIIKYNKFKKRKEYIRENLIFLNDQMLRGLVEINSILNELNEYKLLDININNMSIEQFEELQNEYIYKFYIFINDKQKQIIAIICEYCRKALNQFLKENKIDENDSVVVNNVNVSRQGGKNQATMKRGRYINKKNEINKIEYNQSNAGKNIYIYYNKIALNHCYSFYIKKFIQLCQYLCDNILRNMVIQTYEYFLTILNSYFVLLPDKIDVKNGMEIFMENGLQLYDKASKEVTNKEKEKDGSCIQNNSGYKPKNDIHLFNVVLTIEEGKLKIFPECDLLITTVEHYINASIEIVNKRENFLNHFKIKNMFKSEIYVDDIIFKNRKVDICGEGKIGNEKKNIFDVESDVRIQKMKIELREKLKSVYNLMVDSCNEFNNIIFLHNKYKNIKVEEIDIMDVSYISGLFENFKELENKIKKINKEININIFKVNNNILIDYLLKGINTKWGELINYLPSLNKTTISNLALKLDEAYNHINKTPTNLSELVKYINFTNNFNNDLLNIEESVESISSLFLLFKKHYININGSYTTKLFHIKQKINSLKTILHSDPNYEIQFNSQFKDLVHEINVVEKKIQNFINIIKNDVFKFSLEYSVDAMESALKLVTPIEQVEQVYFKSGEAIDEGVNKNERSDGTNQADSVTAPFLLGGDNEIVVSEEAKKGCYIFELLEFIRTNILEIKKDVEKYIYYQKILKTKKNEFVNFSLLKNIFINTSLTVYTYFMYICFDEKYKLTKIVKLDVDKLEKEISNINVHFKKMNKNFIDIKIYNECNKFYTKYENVFKILKMINLIYKNKKHFGMLIDIINSSDSFENVDTKMDDENCDSQEIKQVISYEYNDIILKNLLSLDYSKNISKVENVFIEYEKEEQINADMDIIKIELKKHKLDVSLMNKKVYYISNIDHILKELRKILNKLILLGNNHSSRHIYTVVYNISESILTFTNILSLVKKIQNCYKHIDKYKQNEIKNITNLDIFTNTISNYKNVCEDFFIYPQVSKHIKKEYDVYYFRSVLEEFEKIKIDVEKYILEKKRQYPIFYLLQDKDLLNIYSDVSSLKKINIYIKKLFPQFKKVIIQNESICGMLSIDGEQIIFKESIKFKKLDFLLNEIGVEIKNYVLQNILTHVNNKKFFTHLSEETYLYFININNLQLLYILLSIYFTSIFDNFVEHSYEERKNIIYLLSRNINKIASMSIECHVSPEISRGCIKKYSKNILFLLCFFIHIKDRFSSFRSSENVNITNHSFEYLKSVKHYIRDSNYYITQFNNKIKYTYEFLDSFNYTLDLIYEWESYGFFLQNYINNNLIMLSQNRNNKFINTSKNFSVLLGYNYVFINNVNLNRDKIYNYIACSLFSNISFYFFNANTFKEDIIQIFKNQFSKINNYLKSAKKFINIKNHEYTLNKKPLIFISLQKNVLPLSNFNITTKNDTYQFDDLCYQFSFHKPFKKLSISFLFFIFFSNGFTKCHHLAVATYRLFDYLLQHDELKRWIFEGRIGNLLKESVAASEKTEYSFFMHVINYVSNFLDASKLKEIVSTICLIYKISMIKQKVLYKYASKIVTGSEDEETEMEDKTDSFSIEPVPNLEQSRENKIKEIIKNLEKEKKLIVLKYQVVKAVELFDILSQNMKMNSKDEGKDLNNVDVRTENKITNIIINGKEYSGISTIIYILHNLLVNIIYEECLVEKINLKYCSEDDVLKFALRNLNSFLFEKKNELAKEINSSQKYNLLYSKFEKTSGHNNKNETKLDIQNSDSVKGDKKRQKIFIKYIKVDETKYIEKIVNYTCLENNKMCIEINKENCEFNNICFIYKSENLSKISPYFFKTFHYIHIKNAVPYISFLTFCVENLKIYKSAQNKIIRHFEDLVIETVKFFKQEKEANTNRFETKYGDKEKRENDKLTHSSIDENGKEIKNRQADITESLNNNSIDCQIKDKQNNETKNLEDECIFETDEEIFEFSKFNEGYVSIHINTLICTFIKFIDYFLKLLVEKKKNVGNKKLIDTHLNNIITISFIYTFTAFMEKEEREKYENYIIKYINNISIIPKNTSFTHIYYNIESNKILKKEKIYKNEKICLNKNTLMSNTIADKNYFFLFEDLNILSIKNFIKISTNMSIPFIIIGGSSSGKSLCIYNFLNSYIKKNKNAQQNIYNFIFRFNHSFKYTNIIHKLRKTFNLSTSQIKEDVTIFLDDINCLSGDRVRSSFEFFHQLINQQEYFDTEENKNVSFSNCKILGTLNHEYSEPSGRKNLALSKIYRNFFILNISSLTPKNIHSLYFNIIEYIFLKYNFCEDMINECQNFIGCILETFESITLKKEKTDLSLHTNMINNIINYLLIYDKESCSNMNEIGYYFLNDMIRIFCSDVIFYDKNIEYTNIIKKNFEKYFPKYVTNDKYPLNVNIQNNMIYIEKEEQNMNTNIDMNYLKRFFPVSKYEHLDIFYNDILSFIKIINTYLIFRQSNIIFLNHQNKLLKKIVSIYCYYKSCESVFLKWNDNEMKNKIRVSYTKRIEKLSKLNEINLDTSNENTILENRTVFFGKLEFDEEYLNFFDLILYNCNLDNLYDNFVNEHYLYIINMLKHKEKDVEGNLENFVISKLLDSNHYLFYTNNFDSFKNTYFYKYRNIFKKCYTVHLNFYKFYQKNIFSFNLSMPIYNYVNKKTVQSLVSNINDVENRELYFISHLSSSVNKMLAMLNNKKDIPQLNHYRENADEDTYKIYEYLNRTELNVLVERKKKIKNVIESVQFGSDKVMEKIKDIKNEIATHRDKIKTIKRNIKQSLIAYKENIMEAKNKLNDIKEEDFEYFKYKNKNNYMGYLKILYLYINKKNDKTFIQDTFSYHYIMKCIKKIDENKINKSLILKYENMSNVQNFLNYKFVYIIHLFIISMNDYIKKRESLKLEYESIKSLESKISSLDSQIVEVRLGCVTSKVVSSLLAHLLSLYSELKLQIKQTRKELVMKSIHFGYCCGFNDKEKRIFFKLLVDKKCMYERNTSDGEASDGMSDGMPDEMDSTVNKGEEKLKHLMNHKNFISIAFLREYKKMNLCNDNMIIYTCHMLEIIKKKINICVDPFCQIKKYFLKKIKESEKKYVYIKYHSINKMSIQSYNQDDECKEVEKGGNENLVEKISQYVENNYVIIFKGLDADLLQMLSKICDKSFVENIYIFINMIEQEEYIKTFLENNKNILYVYCDYRKNNVLNLFSYYYQKCKGIPDDVKIESVEKENHLIEVTSLATRFLDKEISEEELKEKLENIGKAEKSKERNEKQFEETNFLLIYTFYVLVETLKIANKNVNFINHRKFIKIIKSCFEEIDINNKSSYNDILNYMYFHIVTILKKTDLFIFNFLLSIYLDIFVYKFIKWADLFLFFRNYRNKNYEKNIESVYKNDEKFLDEFKKEEKYLFANILETNEGNDNFYRKIKGNDFEMFYNTSSNLNNIYDEYYQLIDNKLDGVDEEEKYEGSSKNEEAQETNERLKPLNRIQTLSANLNKSYTLLYIKKRKLKGKLHNKYFDDEYDDVNRENKSNWVPQMYNEYKDEDVNIILEKENGNKISIIYYIKELEELFSLKKKIYRNVLRNIYECPDKWNEYISSENLKNKIEFPMKELNEPCMYFYKISIDKIIKKDSLNMLIQEYILTKLSNLIYKDKKMVYNNFYNFFRHHIISSSEYGSDIIESSNKNINDNLYFFDVLKKQNYIIFLLEKNIYSNVILNMLLKCSKALFLDFKHVENISKKISNMIVADVYTISEVLACESFIENILKNGEEQNVGQKVFIIFYNNINILTEKLVTISFGITLDFSFDSFDFLNYINFVFDLVEIYKLSVCSNHIYSKHLFLSILFFILINEYAHLENMNINFDITNEIILLVKLFNNLKGGLKNDETEKMELSVVNEENLMCSTSEKRNERDESDRCRTFFLNYFTNFLDRLFSEKNILMKNMIESFLYNLFSLPNKNTLCNNDNIFKHIPTNLITLKEMIKYVLENIEIFENIIQKNKVSNIYKMAYNIKSMEKIFISKCCITNIDKKTSIFNIILLSFDQFDSFYFVNQPLNSTAQLNYLIQEYNMILSRVYEMKKEIEYYLSTSKLSKISTEYSAKMERSLLRYKVPWKWRYFSDGEKCLYKFFEELKNKLNYIKELIRKEQKGERNVYNISMFTNPMMFFYSVYFTHATNMNTNISELSVSLKFSEKANENERGVWIAPIKIYKGLFVKGSEKFMHQKIHNKNDIYFKVQNEENKWEDTKPLNIEKDNSDNNLSKPEGKDESSIQKDNNPNIENLNEKPFSENTINMRYSNSYMAYARKKDESFYYDSPYILIKIKKKKESMENKKNNEHDKIREDYENYEDTETIKDDESNSSKNIIDNAINMENVSNQFFDLFENKDKFDDNEFIYYCPIMKFNPYIQKDPKLQFFLPLPCIHSKIICKKHKVHMLL